MNMFETEQATYAFEQFSYPLKRAFPPLKTASVRSSIFNDGIREEWIGLRILQTTRAMQSQQFLPTESLRPYVRYFWTLENTQLSTNEQTFKVISDGCPGFIFQNRTPVFVDAQAQSLPQVFVYGQTTRHTHHLAKAGFSILGVYFQPHALKALLGLNAYELCDEQVDLNLLLNQGVTSLTDQLLYAQHSTDQIRILSEFFLNQLRKNERSPDARVRYGIQQINASGGTLGLATLQKDLRITERSLERLFRQEVGITPKLYTRIAQFQASLQQLRARDYEKFSDLAYQHAYADQSHFIRSFKEFSGVTPQQFCRQLNEQVENFPEWVS